MIKEEVFGHESRPFPTGWRGKRIADIDLTVLDCDGIAHILTMVEANGVVSSRSKKSIRECIQQFRTVMPELPGDVQPYFGELGSLLEKTAHQIGIREE